jgi:hypothetical protein
MPEILGRLVRLTRAHLQAFLEQRWYGRRTWHTDDHRQDDPEDTSHFSPPPYGGGGLPYSEELARCYRVLDLPFGVPMEQVARQWKTYLKKCHPDRYANDPEKQVDATKLTQELTRAYEKIKGAWEQHPP